MNALINIKELYRPAKLTGLALLICANYSFSPSAHALDSTNIGGMWLNPGPSTYVLAMGNSFNSLWSYYDTVGQEWWALRMYTPNQQQCRYGTQPYVQTSIQWAQSDGDNTIKFIGLKPNFVNGSHEPLYQNITWNGYSYEIPTFIKVVTKDGADRSRILFSWVLYCIPNTNALGDTYIYR